MTLAEYVDDITLMLGGTCVDLEIQKDIPKCVNKAFREIKQYVTTPAYITVPFGANVLGQGTTIDLSDKNIYNVICVMRPNSYNSLSMNTLDVFGLNQVYSSLQKYS